MATFIELSKHGAKSDVTRPVVINVDQIVSMHSAYAPGNVSDGTIITLTATRTEGVSQEVHVAESLDVLVDTLPSTIVKIR